MPQSPRQVTSSQPFWQKSPRKQQTHNGNGTQALDPRFRELITYHGRDYQRVSLEEQINLAPVDDDEISRLEEQHQMMNLIFSVNDNPLAIVPLDGVSRVLDCGHGTASWAREFAEWDPDSQVVGTDITPEMNPDDVPDNLELQVANLNDPFTFRANTFDLVNSRFVASGISFTRWPNYVRDIERILKPGRWAQLFEWRLDFRSDSQSAEKMQALQRWSTTYAGAVSTSATPQGKKDPHPAIKLENFMRMAGFVNVNVDIREIPMSPWPARPRQRQIGEMNRNNIKQLLQAAALFPVTYRQHMSVGAFQRLVEDACAELDDLSSKPFLMLYACRGKKRG